MTINELYALTQWAEAHIENAQIPGFYSALQASLNQYAQPNQRARSFEEEKGQLLQAVKNAQPQRLTHAQVAFLDSLSVSQYIGDSGVAHIEDLLFRNVIDVATSASKFGEIAEVLNTALAKLNQIRKGLDGLVSEETLQPDGEVLIRVTFAGKAGLRNLSEFKEWGKTWYEIGRGIAMAHGKAPEDVKVVGAGTGSIVVVLATAALIAHTTSFIILRGLAIAERVLDLKMKAEDLRSMKLKNDKLADDLVEAAENEKTSGIDQITHDAAKALKLTKAKNGEEIAALSKSVEQLLNFIENGGEVDFVLPEPAEDGAEDATTDLKQLRATYAEIRQLESKLALLEQGERNEA